MPEITDDELSALRQRAEAGQSAAAALDKAQQDLSGLQNADQRAQAATAALLDQTRAANPSVPPELITGDDPDAIRQSLEAARATVAKVQELNPPQDAQQTAPGTTAASPTRDTGQPPENVRGVSRIAFALNNPGQGNTEE